MYLSPSGSLAIFPRARCDGTRVARASRVLSPFSDALEKRGQAQPDYGPVLCIPGLIDAGLGHKEETLREGRRAIELLSAQKDSCPLLTLDSKILGYSDVQALSSPPTVA